MNKEKKKEKSSFLPYIIEYKEKLVFKLEENCKKFIEFTDLYLLSKENDDKSKVFYYKINGDNYRRMAEAEENSKKDIIEKANSSYNNALNYSKNLDIIDSLRLGLLLNFSVFNYENLNNPKKAIEICRNTIKESETKLKGADEDDDDVKDSISIINLMKENLELWESEN